ncbi:MAG: glycosyltransferase family 9 protein, partial [Bacteroidota bacterium]
RQAEDLARSLAGEKSFRTTLIYAPGDEEMRKVATNLADTSECVSFPEAGTASLLEIASLVEGALCVITPDTAIVHFASAMKTPILGLFTPLQGIHEWLPYKVRHELVTADPGKPVSSIPLDVMRKRAMDFIHAKTHFNHSHMPA